MITQNIFPAASRAILWREETEGKVKKWGGERKGKMMSSSRKSDGAPAAAIEQLP